MDVKELIKKRADEVRKSADLTAVYIEEFKNIFGYIPDCAPCSISKDYELFKRFVISGEKPKQKKIIMAKEKTFKLKDNKVRILAYKNKKGKRVMRYTNRMDENFVIDYLSNGTKEEKEVRKKEFSVLPESLTKTEEPEPKQKVSEILDLIEKAEVIEQLEHFKDDTRKSVIKAIEEKKAELSAEKEQ